MSTPTVLSETDSPCAMGDRRATGSISVVTNVKVAAASTNSRIAVADGRVSGRAAEGSGAISTEYTLSQRKIMTIVSDPRSRAGEVLAAINARPGIARAGADRAARGVQRPGVRPRRQSRRRPVAERGRTAGPSRRRPRTTDPDAVGPSRGAASRGRSDLPRDVADRDLRSASAARSLTHSASP